MEPAADIVRQLRDAGLRVTAPRVAVLGVLAEQYRSNEDFRAMRERQLKAINEHVKSVGADAIFEVVEEYVPAGR
jgi:Fe2+ or Zn2+ uptake regulation protein